MAPCGWPARPALAYALLLLLAGCTSGPSKTPPGPGVTIPVSDPPPADIKFTDVASQAGISYQWAIHHTPLRINEANRAGCAFFDYDNDGWLDILLVGPDGLALYRNERGQRFSDVTKQTGLSSIRGYWMGCAIGDTDSDGNLDILITGYRCVAMLKNVGGSRFTDVTRESGFDPSNGGRWGLSAGFMDLDGSGNLAAVVTNYVDFGPKDQQYCEPVAGVKAGCSPQGYKPEHPQLFQNDGKGHFKDVTDTAGVKPLHGNAMALAFADVTGSGRMDFYIGNDGKQAELFQNLGGMRFKNVGRQSGVADYMSHAIAAMGCDWADYDRDGRPDLAVSAFSDEAYSVYRNEGNALFTYVSEETGITGPTYRALAFGAKWLDMDNDGWADVAFANGHVYDNASAVNAAYTFKQPLMLFRNIAGGKNREFEDIAPQMPGIGDKHIVGRGLASGDYDNDGRVDLLVANLDGPPMLLHNESTTQNHWVTVALSSRGRNHFGYGAHVRLRAAGQTWDADVSPASSFLSSSDPRVHFGLGSTTKIEELQVRWSDGTTDVWKDQAVDQILKLQQRNPRR